MTICQFTAIDEIEQIDVFWDGSLIGERLHGEYKVVCKRINNFYVEYLMLGDIYKAMRAFDTPELLQPYLDQMAGFS